MIQSVLFILIPAGVANIMASLSRYIFPRWTRPINERWFGDHKTWRGLIVGSLVGALVGVISGNIYVVLMVMGHDSWRAELGLQSFYFFIVAFLIALGALLGDLVKSFFKRRIGIAPGKSWIPFDQIDWILGSLVVVMVVLPLLELSAFALSEMQSQNILFTLLIGGMLHPIFNGLGKLLKLQKNWL